MNRQNYQLELDKILSALGERKPNLLLHACCAPCASYVLEYLAPHFDIALFFYNPNIQPFAEYEKRLAELHKLTGAMGFSGTRIYEGEYPENDTIWSDCFACQSLRIEKTAELAVSEGFEFFCSTLTISPHKDAVMINELGTASERNKTKWLPCDFKKRGGFLRSVELCREYGIYRQNYCGCMANKS